MSSSDLAEDSPPAAPRTPPPPTALAETDLRLSSAPPDPDHSAGAPGGDETPCAPSSGATPADSAGFPMGNDVATADMTPDDWKQQGNAAFQAQDYGNAIVFYTNGIELEPTNAALFSNRSAAHLKTGNTSKARLDADTCIKLDEHWPKGWWRRGQAQMEAQEYTQARETFREGLTFCPNDDNLTRGLENAQKRVTVLESVQGQGEADFDPEGPSRRVESDGIGKTANADPAFPGTADEEIQRIQAAPNHYAILHVSPDSPASQIKKNYHILARLLHPDKCHQSGSSEAMSQVSLAYDTLTNVVKKTLYDQFMSQTAEGDKEQTYAEWEAKQQPVEIPKWLAWLLSIKGCGWFLATVMLIIILPIVLLCLIVFFLVWCLCCPYRTVLRYCFPEKYAQKREAAERQRAKDEEAALDRQFPV